MDKEFSAQKDTFENLLKELLERKVESKEELEKWLYDQSDVYFKIDEVMNKDYVAFQCHNDDAKAKEKFTFDQEVLEPLLKDYKSKLDEFFYNNKYRDEIDREKYDIVIKSIVNSIELFRKKNIELEVEENKLVTDYYSITGSMTVEWEGEEKTLQQMGIYLKNSDRTIREKAWKLIQSRRLKDAASLDDIMDGLIKIRKEKALNADLKNYRDYMFKKYERFLYKPEDCYSFHEAVLKNVVPLAVEIQKKHAKEIGVEDYRPWDMEAVPKGKQPLKPFNKIDELVEGVIRIFDRNDKEFGNLLRRMRDSKTLDLESRKAKSPGGFCTYYNVSEIPFIFMNASGLQGDMVTLTHEGGHSVHNMLSNHLKLSKFRDTPMESAEFASMGMELLCMDKWDEFYKNEEDIKRAKREQLEGIIKFLPWAMVVDKFQHWMYLNPEHTANERNEEFTKIANEFMYPFVNWDGYEEELKNRWKSQLHIFEVPFYYIEYAIAQLGALQIWKEYKEDPKRALSNYKKALSLGNSKSLPEVYRTAGIKFDFSEKMIKELMEFVAGELEKL